MKSFFQFTRKKEEFLRNINDQEKKSSLMIKLCEAKRRF